MHSKLLTIVVGLCAAGVGFAVGLRHGRHATEQERGGSHAKPPSAVVAEEERAASKVRRDRIARFPTVVMESSRKPEYRVSPYPDWLIKVRCRGVPGDLKQDFLAVFQCVGGRAPMEALGLEKGMRLRLDMAPIEERPASMKTWPMADDVDDVTLPVFWVRGFQHDEPRLMLGLEPGRAHLAGIGDESVLKSPTIVSCGGVETPFYFYGANWGIYEAEAAERLRGIRPGSPMVAVKHLHEWLLARGVRLVFAPVPQSASLFPDVALGRFDGSALKGHPANTPVREMLNRLRSEGVTVIDLTSELRSRRVEEHEGLKYLNYLPNDTHWSSGGARIAAAQVARELTKAQFIPPNAQSDDGTSFEVRLLAQAYNGDMGHVSAVESLGVKVTPVPALHHQVFPMSARAKALLAEPGPEAVIHCVGDSNLAAHRALQAGFVDHLVRETGLPVHAVVGLGCGHHAAMRGWLRDGSGGKAKVLLWMPSERYLAYDEWIDVQAEPAVPR